MKRVSGGFEMGRPLYSTIYDLWHREGVLERVREVLGEGIELRLGRMESSGFTLKLTPRGRFP